MKQLGVLDTAFVNLETRPTPQHLGGLSIYDPSTALGGSADGRPADGRPERFKEIIASFERRLQRSFEETKQSVVGKTTSGVPKKARKRTTAQGHGPQTSRVSRMGGNP